MTKDGVDRRSFFQNTFASITALVIAPAKYVNPNLQWSSWKKKCIPGLAKSILLRRDNHYGLDFSGMTGCGSILAEGNSICDSSGYWDEDDEDMEEEIFGVDLSSREIYATNINNLGQPSLPQEFKVFSYNTNEFLRGAAAHT